MVSFHLVTQFNAGDGLGTAYDSSTGTATVQFPLSPPPVTGTYFAILFTDAGANNVLNLILAGPPSNFGGGPVVPSVPLQQVNGSLLSEELSLISFVPRRESAAGILLSGPPSTAAPVPAMTLPWVSVAFILLAALGAKSLCGSRLRERPNADVRQRTGACRMAVIPDTVLRSTAYHLSRCVNVDLDLGWRCSWRRPRIWFGGQSAGGDGFGTSEWAAIHTLSPLPELPVDTTNKYRDSGVRRDCGRWRSPDRTSVMGRRQRWMT